MNELYAYHVVTEKPMYLGQHVVFDDKHHSGVYNRVMEKIDVVNDIYSNPNKYANKKLEHHTMVALRELALEKVRKGNYPNCPSRLSCLYVSKSIEEAENWVKYFLSLGRPVYSIVKLKVNGDVFEGDANNCFEATINEEINLMLAKRYWDNCPNLQNETSIKEILVSGDIEVVEFVKEIGSNL